MNNSDNLKAVFESINEIEKELNLGRSAIAKKNLNQVINAFTGIKIHSEFIINYFKTEKKRL